MDPIYWYSFVKRPYVFVFFLAWLILSKRHLGLKNTALWMMLGFGIAWISEASSIRTGFPYGWYFYRYENLRNEWILWGVPAWDSLSYVFLSYAGLCMSLSLWRSRPCRFSSRITRPFLERLYIALTTGAFTTLLDIIIDPVAYQGKKWFLGEIYYYPYPGYYFDIPASNFAGWFLVSTAITFTFLLFVSRREPLPNFFWNRRALFLGALFYMSIALFNTVVSAWIGDWVLATVDFIYLAILASFLYLYVIRPSSSSHH